MHGVMARACEDLVEAVPILAAVGVLSLVTALLIAGIAR
jgi:hypothetical protein